MFFEKIRKSGVLLLTASCLLVGMWVENTSLLAQEKFGSLNGTVTDASGGVLPGVTVSVTNKTTNRSRTITTGSDGTYTFNDLEPGTYSIKFELAGFSTLNYP